MDLENQQRVKDAAEKYGVEDLVVVLGSSDPEGAEVYAETVTLGDPTFAGPLAGAPLGLCVYHVLEPEMKAEADPRKWEEQIGMMEMVLNGDALAAAGASDLIVSLVVDGIIGGVGAVLGFVPQMAILFLFLSILEDCGYMVRIAFVMDRVFRHFGLSGKSFIPLLISSGCGVPGIMASKTIEQDNDRRLTIMTATFVPCGAKLPVIALMGGVMAGYMSGDMDLATMMAPIMYFVGIVAVLVSAIMLKKTKPFSGKPAPFVMELPAYHIPSAKTVLLHVWERLKGFIIKAGTILFLACVVMWFLSSFGFVDGGFGLVEESADSILAMLGGAIAILFRPLGFGEWQPVAASITGFTAKEAIVSTMGVLANVSEDLSEETDVVAAAIQTWFPTTIAAFTFLLFNLLDSPCLAAIATMAQQLQSRKWFWFAILYQNLFSYAVSLIVYQLGGLVLGAVAFNVWISWQQSFWYSCCSCCSVRIHIRIRRATQEAL